MIFSVFAELAGGLHCNRVGGECSYTPIYKCVLKDT